MASFLSPIAGALTGGLTSLAGGIIGSIAAGKAGRTIGAAGTAGSTAIGTAGNEAAAATNAAGQSGVTGITSATNTGVAGVNSAAAAGQAGVGGAVTSGQAGVTGAVTGANQLQQQAQAAQTSNLNPYLATGTQGTNAESALLTQGFQDPTAAQAAATPGEQFQMQQGAQLLQQQAAAEGGVDTGGELKALTQYGQGVASTYYQNAVNNAAQAYGINLGAAQTAAGQGQTATSQLNQELQNSATTQGANLTAGASENAGLGLTGATTSAGLGLTGATTAGQLGLSGASTAGSLGLTAATTAGNQNLTGTEAASNMFLQGAQGTAAGQLGQSTAIQNGLGGVANAVNGYFGTGGYYGSGGTYPYGYGVQGGGYGAPAPNLYPSTGQIPFTYPGFQSA
jgi:hypothetical protein